MTSIGECLRRERLRRNLQLEQVSNELKISSRMLAAIEAEDFNKLPGGVFAKSFVRQYAHLLGLDEDEMANEVERMLRPDEPAEARKPDLEAIPLPRMEAWQSVGDRPGWQSGWSASLPALVLVVVVMLVCSGIYALWQRPKPAVSAGQAPAVSHPQATQAPAQPSAQSAPAPAPVPVPASAETPQPAVPSPSNTAAREAEPAAPAAGAAPQTAAAAGPPGPVHVEITATEPVWVRATSDGKNVFSGILDANQTHTVDGNETVLLRVGNAGGVTIQLNGKPIGEVGPKGQVRNVQLTSGGFQIVAPKSAPVDPL
jgi:cytoskeleton protein RodZ